MTEDINKYNILRKGEIIYYNDKYRYLDQIDGKTLISGNDMARYLRKRYDISPQEYYNLVMYGDINNSPKCLYCDNPREFIKISQGYKSRCKICLDKSHIHKKKPKSKLALEGKHNFQTQSKESRTRAHINSSRNTFINRAKLRNINVAYMYCGLLDSNNFKIGITFVNISRRSKLLKLVSGHKVKVGTPEYISNLELELKYKFLDKCSYK